MAGTRKVNRRWVRRTKDRRIWLLLGSLVVAGALGVFSYPYVGRVYDKLKAKTLARRAANSCAKGDYKSAVLQAGKVLEIDRNNLSATRTVARSLDAVRVPVAIQWHRRLEELKPGDAENLIAWSKDALRTGDPVTADAVLKKMKPSDQNSAVYHEVAAGVALAMGDGDARESHLAEAVRLDPGHNQYKINLAKLRLKSTKPQGPCRGVASTRGAASKAGDEPRRIAALD